MAARQFRLLLLAELVFYGLLGGVLMSRAGWSPLQVGGLALAGFFGVRLLLVATTFAIVLADRSPLPPQLRLGPLEVLRMFCAEYLAFVLLFAVIIPFERFWLGPDRLAHCAARPLPLLLIHGYLCNRGFWFWLRRKLEAVGWTVATHNLEPVYADIDSYAEGIARRVDEVLAATGAPQLILVGHSMGGLAIRAYLRRCGADKVARMVSLGSPHNGSRLARLGLGPNARQMRIGSSWLAELAETDALPPGSVSIYSYHDSYVRPPGACLTGDVSFNIAIGGAGHLGLALSPLVFGKIQEALDVA